MGIKVAVSGALGKMGRETVRAVAGVSDLELAALVDREGGELEGTPVWKDLAEALAVVRPQVCVDFTHPSVAVEHALACLEHGAAPIIGTSGIDDAGLERIRLASTATPSLVVPNFAIGAILMMRFAEMAARWLPHCAVVELHRAEKPDAPSGTAMYTAERIAKGRASAQAGAASERTVERIKSVPGAMGGEHHGVPVHSIRLPGHIAHQMVVFGGQGESLTIRHDSLDRTSFMPGVLLAIRKVGSLKGLTVGLEGLMFGA
jgi:4-hydroxy-tetrahydrodipicolinate reductase